MTTAALPARFPSSGAVAPWWHTSIVVAFFLFMAAGGAVLQHRAPTGAAFAAGSRPNLSWLYASMTAAEFGLVAFVYKSGLRRSGTSVSDLVGGSWRSPKAAITDLVLAGATWMLWTGIARLLEALLGGSSGASVSPLLPRTMQELVLWVVLSISAGFAEEVVFRGYLQRQLTAYTGRVPLAVLLQVSVFALAHGYQGAHNCFVIGVYGVLFTSLALWRKSLRPGILAHAWTDIASGLLG